MSNKKRVNPFNKLRVNAELRRSIKVFSKKAIIYSVAFITILGTGILAPKITNAAANLTGQVVLPNEEEIDGNNYVPNTWVDMWDVNGGAWYGTNSDADGKFEFEIEPGKYVIRASSPYWVTGFEIYCDGREEITVDSEDIAAAVAAGGKVDVGTIALSIPNVTGVLYDPAGTTLMTDAWVEAEKVIQHGDWTETQYMGGTKTEISTTAGYTISCSGFVGTGTRAQLNTLLGK